MKIVLWGTNPDSEISLMLQKNGIAYIGIKDDERKETYTDISLNDLKLAIEMLELADARIHKTT